MSKLDEFRTITQAEIAAIAESLIEDSDHPIVAATVQAMMLRIIHLIESPRGN